MNLLTSNVFIVTGGSAGIGFGICAYLLQHNASRIYILSNKESHAKEAIEALADWGDTTKIDWKACNFEDLKQVREVGAELSILPQINALICNAGLGSGVYHESVDGIDTHMQVNVFSQHLLLMLLPALLKTQNSRVVLQSSELHRAAPSDTEFNDLIEINRDIGPTYLYNRTKLAQILLVRWLTRLLYDAGKSSSIWINATHPGAVSTDQPKQAEEAYGALGKIGVAVIRPFMKDPVKQGCKPALYAATSNEIVEKQIQGAYIVPDKKVTEPSTQALDEGLAKRLWDLAENVIREKLGELPYATV